MKGIRVEIIPEQHPARLSRSDLQSVYREHVKQDIPALAVFPEAYARRLADAAARRVVEFLESKLRECKHFSPLDDLPAFRLHAILDSDWQALREAVGLDKEK